MKFEQTALEGVWLIEQRKARDDRGFFSSLWSREEFAEKGLNTHLNQTAVSYNEKPFTLRGMHFQTPPHAQAKLVTCLQGEIYDVVLDLRPHSRTFMKWLPFLLNAENGRMLYIPEGCAHGYQTLAGKTLVFYQMSGSYVPEAASGIRWNDPFFKIHWPETAAPILSDQDKAWPDYKVPAMAAREEKIKLTEDPKVTIAIPTFNRMNYLEESLDCALNQTYPNVEVLIGDSSQTDEIRKQILAIESPKVRYFRYPPEITQAEKFNNLLNEASGEWVVFLGDDDLLDHDYLRTMVKRIKERPDAVLVRCRKTVINEDGETVWTEPVSKPVMRPAEFVYRLSLPQKKFFKMNLTGVLFRRDRLISIGGFLFTPAAWHLDYLTWMSLGALGPCLFEKETLCSIRLHARFHFDVDSLIQANAIAKNLGEKLIFGLSFQVQTPEEKKYLRLANKSHADYLKRHMKRALDHAFISELEAQKPQLPLRFNELLQKMKAYHIPLFLSCYFYWLFKFLPLAVRRTFLHYLKSYKIWKQSEGVHAVARVLQIPVGKEI